MKKIKNYIKMLISICLVLMIVVSSGLNGITVLADDSSLIFNYVQSGQINWDGYTSYKFSIDSYANLSIDFDCKYTYYGAKAPKIIIVTESDYNDWKIGKSVDNKYYSEAETVNTYDFWCDDVASLDSGDYRIIIDNSQGWGYYSTNYTLCVDPVVIDPIISHSDSCQSVTLNFKTDLGTQGYYIEQLIDNEYVNIETIKSSVQQIKISNLNPNTYYYFRVRGYSVLNSVKYYSEWVNLNALTEHTYADVVTQPSCTAVGFTTHTCTICGDCYVDNYVSPTIHSFNGGKNCVVCGAVNPKCVEPIITAPVQTTTTQPATTVKKPKSTSIKKLTKGKKQFKATWKKVSGVAGYQIQYSTDKKFKKNNKTVTAKKGSTSATVKKLKSKKTYYVRIRTYKTVKINGKSTKVYSSWSKVKSVKTK